MNPDASTTRLSNLASILYKLCPNIGKPDSIESWILIYLNSNRGPDVWWWLLLLQFVVGMRCICRQER